MKNFIKRKQVQAVMFLFAVLFGVLSVCSGMAVLITERAGLYNYNSFDKALKDEQEYLQKMYSYWILYSEKHPNSEAARDFSDINMKYVIKKDGKTVYSNCDESELKNPYKVTLDEGNLEDSGIDGGNSSLEICSNVFNVLLREFGFFYTNGSDKERYLKIEDILFNKKDNKFYLNFGNMLIPMNTVYFAREDVPDIDDETYSKDYLYDDNRGSYYAYDEEVYEDEGEVYEDDEEVKDKKTEEIKFEISSLKKEWDHVYFDDDQDSGISCRVKDLKILDDINDLGISVDEKAQIVGSYPYPSSWNECYFAIYSPDIEPNQKSYTVLSEVLPYEKMEEDTVDVFYQLESLMIILFDNRYNNIIMSVICAVICLCFICLYVYGRYTRSAEGEWAVNNLMRKIPLELYLLAAGAVIITSYAAAIESFEMLPGILNENIVPLIWIFVLCAAVIFTVGMLVIGETCVRMRDKVLLESMMLHAVYKYFRRICSKIMKIISENVNLFAKVIVIFVVISGAELLVILSTDYAMEMELLLWLVWKIVELLLVFKITVDLRHIQEKAKLTAHGNSGYKLNTDKMWWEIRKHGDYLNMIDNGVEIAVQKQMKSERMRTELITNVSHDIKTPLTSIINYADLLQKDGVSEEERAQYLDVLNRKSAELKKLIEDLIEASKASTGNITVDLQRCDVGVLMVQVLGEFEEKLESNELQLVTKENAGPIEIMADRRHLWRVFDNLMNNICKYSQPGTRVYIDVEMSDEDGNVNIIFRNTSKYPLNISGEELMERFVRGDSSRHTDGNGLGLAIAQSLTDLMKGKINITVDGDLFKVILTFPVSNGTDAAVKNDEQ